jgi:predicted SAM-dependent methyltransferase
VKYLDVLPTEGLRERAVVHGVDPAKIPHIDFVSANGDFAAVTETFDVLLSSHVIEHQPDLVRHLNGAANVLRPGGRYYLAVPDKRYCFDHFIGESSIADIVAAHVQRRSVHSAESVIEHQAMTTHNDCLRHWAGDHGEPAYKAHPARIRQASEMFQRSAGGYIDVHAWQFIPQSFREAIQALYELALIPLRVLRVYPTVRDSNEFYAVLEKVEQDTPPLHRDLPADFDAALYLAANPDVADAGVDAVTHYLAFGRGEGRKLRP